MVGYFSTSPSHHRSSISHEGGIGGRVEVLKYPTIGLGSCGSNWSFHSLHTKLVCITYVAHNSTHSALIKEHKRKELANGNPHFAAGSLGGRNSKDLGESSFSS